MSRACCKAHVWPSGIFFSNETYEWDPIKKDAVRVKEVRYLPRWYPWNTIYLVTTQEGKEETYAVYEDVRNRNSRSWYWDKRNRGLCVRCTRPTGRIGCMCEACREKHNRKVKRSN